MSSQNYMRNSEYVLCFTSGTVFNTFGFGTNFTKYDSVI